MAAQVYSLLSRSGTATSCFSGNNIHHDLKLNEAGCSVYSAWLHELRYIVVHALLRVQISPFRVHHTRTSWPCKTFLHLPRRLGPSLVSDCHTGAVHWPYSIPRSTGPRSALLSVRPCQQTRKLDDPQPKRRIRRSCLGQTLSVPKRIWSSYIWQQAHHYIRTNSNHSWYRAVCPT